MGNRVAKFAGYIEYADEVISKLNYGLILAKCLAKCSNFFVTVSF